MNPLTEVLAEVLLADGAFSTLSQFVFVRTRVSAQAVELLNRGCFGVWSYLFIFRYTETDTM
jgi:hypothetical protein